MNATGSPVIARAPGRTDGSLGTTPPSWMQALLMSRYQFRDYLRSRRFLLMIGIVAAISAILIAVIAHYRPAGLISTGAAFFGSAWIGGVGVLIIFSAIIFGGDAIAGEFQNKTGYYLMGLPIKRWSVYAGKYLAAFGASLVTIGVYFVVLLLAGAYFVGGGAIGAGVFESFALVMLYLAAVLGTTFLFSSLFKTSMYGVIIVAIMFLFGFTIVSALVEGLVGVTPWFIITWAQSALSYPITGLPRTAGLSAAGIVVYPTYAQGIGVMLGYFVGTTLGGLALFEREEFT
ncbi:MAG TPA: ABC transporter permease [Thermoplasmata archaeon]|nr:ABC transporter permease [Thermoplasmata archaeon]